MRRRSYIVMVKVPLRSICLIAPLGQAANPAGVLACLSNKIGSSIHCRGCIKIWILRLSSPNGREPRSARGRTGDRRVSEAQQIFQNLKQKQMVNVLIYIDLINCVTFNKILMDLDNV